MRIQEKYALITGSSRGIGRRIALKLAEKGVKLREGHEFYSCRIGAMRICGF